jgi:hypothetical protein
VHVNVHVCVCVCVWVCVCAVEASVMELGMLVMDAPGHRRRFEGLRCLGWQKGASLARLLLSLSLSLSLSLFVSVFTYAYQVVDRQTVETTMS